MVHYIKVDPKLLPKELQKIFLRNLYFNSFSWEDPLHTIDSTRDVKQMLKQFERHPLYSLS